MPILTENSFERISDPLVGYAETLTLSLLEDVRDLAGSLVDDPDRNVSIQAQVQQAQNRVADFMGRAEGWIRTAIPAAYIRGIQDINGTIRELGIESRERSIPPFSAARAIFGRGGGGNIDVPDSVVTAFDKYPKHLTMYELFAGAVKEDLERAQLPIIRDVQDKVREVVLQASDEAYRSADDFTRRQLSQDIMDRFAKENITGIQYADGRTMKLDTYSEMVARTQTGNAARQAQINRLQEVGHDLVRMSVHWPCSDLCVDWQGGVYDQSGVSDHYPSLDTAIQGGAFHVNCKHSLSGYFPGTSKRIDEADKFSKAENRERYEIEQRQRYNERQIRYWKRREATAMSEGAADKARGKVSQWQQRNRELVDNNDFLRRKYYRESV